jgi:hypothetical protein
VPKSGSLGSARGALSNGRPYREQHRLGRGKPTSHSGGSGRASPVRSSRHRSTCQSPQREAFGGLQVYVRAAPPPGQNASSSGLVQTAGVFGLSRREEEHGPEHDDEQHENQFDTDVVRDAGAGAGYHVAIRSRHRRSRVLLLGPSVILLLRACAKLALCCRSP